MCVAQEWLYILHCIKHAIPVQQWEYKAGLSLYRSCNASTKLSLHTITSILNKALVTYILLCQTLPVSPQMLSTNWVLEGRRVLFSWSASCVTIACWFLLYSSSMARHCLACSMPRGLFLLLVLPLLFPDKPRRTWVFKGNHYFIGIPFIAEDSMRKLDTRTIKRLSFLQYSSEWWSMWNNF